MAILKHFPLDTLGKLYFPSGLFQDHFVLLRPRLNLRNYGLVFFPIVCEGMFRPLPAVKLVYNQFWRQQVFNFGVRYSTESLDFQNTLGLINIESLFETLCSGFSLNIAVKKCDRKLLIASTKDAGYGLDTLSSTSWRKNDFTARIQLPSSD